ncbi:methyltransferase domain-containing protein [Nocardioides marmoraquaticus]
MSQRRDPATVRIDDDGVTLDSAEGQVFDLSFDGRRTWAFTVEHEQRRGRRHLVPWPEQLRPHLDGTAQVTLVRRPDGTTVYDEEVTLGSGTGRLSVEDSKGRPLAVTKYGRLNRAFDSLGEDTKSHYLDQVEEVLAVLRDECGLPAFVSWGTLLGAVRTGHLIGHDVDADLAWFSEHEDPVDVIRESYDIERALRGHGWHVRRENGAFLALFLKQADGSVRNMDVFGCWRTDGVLHLVHDARAPLPVSTILPLGTVELEGRRLPAPADPESLLEACYGPGWRVPDPSFSFGEDRARARRIDGWLGGLRRRRDQWGLVHRDDAARREPAAFTRWAVARATGTGPVVDLGCGDGVDAIAWARTGRPALGVDSAPVAVNRARRLARRAEVTGTEFRTLNLLDLRTTLALAAELSREQQVDLCSRQLWCEVGDQARADLWRLARLVGRPGGSLFLEVHTTRTRLGAAGRDKATIPCRGLPVKRLLAEAREHGATVVEHEPLRDDGQPPRHRVWLRWD